MKPWTFSEQVPVAINTTVVWHLPPSRPFALSKLTIWAVSGENVLGANVVFTPKINTKALGSATTVASGAKINDVIYSAGDVTIPQGSSVAGVHGFDYTVDINNQSMAKAIVVTIYATGLGE